MSVRGEIRPGEEVSIGRPVPGMYAWVLDESLQEVPDGTSGELCIGGVGLARGYHRSPVLTDEKFPVHPELGRIYRTGDLVRRDHRGDYFYLGRIDSQVKLRGYRIELEEIESHLVECPGVREAACCVQGQGVEQRLVAFVVPQQADAPPCFDGIEATLRDVIPAHMVPSRFGLLSRLPTTVAGKLHREALPEIGMPEREAEREVVAPRNETESAIAEVFRSALGLEGGVSIHEDFFWDLGGDSLAAAVTISELRGDERTAGLTVRDLYDARTVSELAERACAPSGEREPVAEECGRPEGNRILAGAIQGAWLLTWLMVGATAAYVASFIVMPFLLRGLGLITFILLAPVLAWGLLVIYAPLSVLLAAVLKKLLIGRYREATAPVWGSLYLRNWMVQQAVRIVPWSLIQGTVLMNWALRMLGARIGKRVHIHRGVNLLQGGWDLLEIGDDVTLCQDAAVRLVDVRDRQLIVAPVRIGDGATVDIRAGVSGHSIVGENAYLTAMSWLRYGDEIPTGERWDGIPARPAGRAPGPAPLSGDDRCYSPAWHGVLLILARFGVGLLSSAPVVALVIGLVLAYGLDSEGVLQWLFGPSFSATVVMPLILVVVLLPPVSLVIQAVVMRLLGAIQPGVISRWCPGYVRIWLKAGMIDAAGGWLSGTLFWPAWLRLAGMRIGRKSEISTIIDVPPECVEVGEESFFADGIYLGCPRIHRNTVTVAPTSLGKNTFIGNHAVVHAGQQLPGDLLLGVCTVADDQVVQQNSSWFGHPPFELPRGGPVTDDRRLTHDPSLIRLVTRLFWESIRFLLPVAPLVSVLIWFKGLRAAAGGVSWLVYWVGIVPGFVCALAVGFCLLVLLAKWTLLGRVKPGQHPFWCCWCSRWDFLYVVWSSYARRILAALEGTPFIHWYLRAMGAKVGRGVVLGGAFAQVVDPDMLEFLDGATVNNHFQAHSFEDRVLKIDRVKIGQRASVNSGAVLFYGADVGTLAWVGPHSVVMKHERLLPETCYVGCPTEEMGSAAR
ncbi:MAG: AMP-binding protein [Candidatus Brocadiae bacterium]|nr:AMP-binding protein [Candidatus Brocadiia bacterium]